MEHSDVNFIRDCLGYSHSQQRKVISYCQDLYAFDILHRHLHSQRPIAEITSGPWASLTRRSGIATCLKQCGDGLLNAQRLCNSWTAQHCQTSDYLPLVIDVTEWGAGKDYYFAQTSRPGSNVVLTLSLDHSRVRNTLSQIGAKREPRWRYHGHPQAANRLTLAWARLDIDLESGEALIEEIQSDLVRFLGWLRYEENRLQEDGEWKIERRLGGALVRADAQTCQQALADLNRPLQAIWAEAMLWQALVFLWDELAIQQIYYHTHDGGARLKNITGRLPPRSLYTTLPKRFGFQLAEAWPQFLRETRNTCRSFRKRGEAQFWKLPLLS